MGIPETFVSELSRKDSYVVYSNVVYQISDAGGETPNCLKAGGISFELIPLLSFSELEELYLHIYESEIHEFKQRVHEKHKSEVKLMNEREFEARLKRHELLNFVFEYIMPSFVKDSDPLASLRGESESIISRLMQSEDTVRTPIITENILKRRMKELYDLMNEYPEIDVPVRPIRKGTNPAITELIKRAEGERRGRVRRVERPEGEIFQYSSLENYAVMGDLVYKLVPSDDDSFDIKFGGDRFKLELTTKVHNVELGYSSDLEKRLKQDSVRHLYEQLSELAVQNEKFEYILNRSELEIGDIGIKKTPSGLTVYLKVDEFVFKEIISTYHQGKFYRIGSCKVGVDISKEGPKITHSDAARIVSPDQYKHPFVQDNSICHGNVNLRPPYSKNSTRLEHIAENIIYILSEGKKVIRQGYTGRAGPWHKAHDVGTEISVDEIKSEGLKITNVSGKELDRIYGRSRDDGRRGGMLIR